MKLTDLLKNKVLIYLTTRYATYGIQFITSILIAAKLGPYYMGVWGFVLLILNYFGQFHFGIANSLNVLLVQHKDNQDDYRIYINNSIILLLILSTIVGLAYIYYNIAGIPMVEEYEVGKYMWAVCLIAVFQYFNGLFSNIFRVRNKLNSISVTQSLIVLLPFTVIFLFEGKYLLDALVASYLLSNLICIIYSFCTGIIPKFSSLDICPKKLKEIFLKGIYLFLYNTCFSFIVISIRSIVSSYYSIEEFGMFTFAFTLGNAVMSLMEAFAFIAFPKVISLFNSNNNDLVESKLMSVREVYMSASHFSIYVFMLLMPLLGGVMPQYHGSIATFNLIVLALALNSNNFGHSSLLIARNKEKKAAIISAIALIINIVVAELIIQVLHVGYNNVAFATLIANLFICLATYYLCSKELSTKIDIANFFPLRLLVPYIVAIVVSLFGLSHLLWFPLTIFIALNIPTLKKIITIAIHMIKDASIINI